MSLLVLSDVALSACNEHKCAFPKFSSSKCNSAIIYSNKSRIMKPPHFETATPKILPSLASNLNNKIHVKVFHHSKFPLQGIMSILHLVSRRSHLSHCLVRCRSKPALGRSWRKLYKSFVCLFIIAPLAVLEIRTKIMSRRSLFAQALNSRGPCSEYFFLSAGVNLASKWTVSQVFEICDQLWLCVSSKILEMSGVTLQWCRDSLLFLGYGLKQMNG